LSRNGTRERLPGEGSEVIVFEALPADRTAFADLDQPSALHHAELVAMDRSIGTLRSGLRDLGIAENTLVWFKSDNGRAVTVWRTPGGGGSRSWTGLMAAGSRSAIPIDFSIRGHNRVRGRAFCGRSLAGSSLLLWPIDGAPARSRICSRGSTRMLGGE
jgi:hypothetical protein